MAKAMRKKGDLADQSTEPMVMSGKKPAIIIHPYNASRQVTGQDISPLQVRWRSALRLMMDLLCVCILIAALWLVVVHTIGSLQGTKSLPVCGRTLPCSTSHQSSSPSTMTPTATATPGMTIMMTGVAQEGNTPGSVVNPTPKPTLQPTPIGAQLSTPSLHISVSRTPFCAQKLALPLKLMNTGGASLLWWEDTVNTSPGILIKDPANMYLIQPGKTVNVNMFCSPNLTKEHYHLQLLYNGGALDIAINVI